MPDREQVEKGDLVMAVFWDGVFTRWYGKVKVDADGELFIETEENMRGYLKDAHEVRKAVINKDNLCFSHYFAREEMEGEYLVCVPLLKDGTPNWEANPETCLPKPTTQLRNIADELRCELYV